MKRYWVTFLSCFTICIITARNISATNIYVHPTNTADSGTLGDGSCANPDFNVIQDAIDAVGNDDTVRVCDGIYVENINFAGKAITLQSVSGTVNTIIDGSASGSVVTFNSGEGNSSTLEGFSLTNGSGTTEGPMIHGGGIYCRSASPTIINCDVKNNTAGSGGGIYCGTSASPIIINCTLSENETEMSGGGILCNNFAAPFLTNLIIFGNYAKIAGGAILCNSSSSPTISNCTVAGNKANAGSGGILCNSSSSPIILNSIFWGNRVNGNPGEITLSYSSIDISYSNIEGGEAGIGGYGSTYTWGSGNISQNPLFLDPRPASEAPTNVGDYHLTALSACINTGTLFWPLTNAKVYTPEYDFEADPRLASVVGDDMPDMGADEFFPDVNLDNYITPKDALLALKHFLNIEILFGNHKKRADVEKFFGVVDDNDVNPIFRKSLALPLD